MQSYVRNMPGTVYSDKDRVHIPSSLLVFVLAVPRYFTAVRSVFFNVRLLCFKRTFVLLWLLNTSPSVATWRVYVSR